MAKVNFLDETESNLEAGEWTWNDVRFVYANGHYFTDMNIVREMMDFEYDPESNRAEIDQTLMIVGDGWYLERIVYSGEEWWEPGSFPVMPESGSGVIYNRKTFKSY